MPKSPPPSVTLYLAQIDKAISRHGGAKSVLLITESASGPDIYFTGYDDWETLRASAQALVSYASARMSRWAPVDHGAALKKIGETRQWLVEHRAAEVAKKTAWEAAHPHKCGACHERYKTAGALKAHIGRVVKADRPYYTHDEDGKTIKESDKHRPLLAPAESQVTE